MRKLLVINESRTVRNLIRRYVLSNMLDVLVSEASSAEEAISMLKKQGFELVVSANEMSGIKGPELYKKCKDFPLNKKTPFIILTSSRTGEKIKELEKCGVEHYLLAPFSADELQSKINHVCDPRKLRVHTRHCIPDAESIIHIGNNKNIVAKIVNLSLTGVLCELEYSNEYTHFLKSCEMTIIFPAECNNVQTKRIHCRLMRFNSLNFRENNEPKDIQVVWEFVNISEKNKKILTQVFQKTQEDLDKLAKVG